MGMQQFRAPAIPLPPDEYNRQQFDEIFKALRLYFSQLDSNGPLQLDGLRLLNLATSGNGLPNGTVFRIGEDLKIVVPNIAYLLGVSGQVSVGSVGVAGSAVATIITGTEATGSVGTVTVTTV